MRPTYQQPSLFKVQLQKLMKGIYLFQVIFVLQCEFFHLLFCLTQLIRQAFMLSPIKVQSFLQLSVHFLQMRILSLHLYHLTLLQQIFPLHRYVLLFLFGQFLLPEHLQFLDGLRMLSPQRLAVQALDFYPLCCDFLPEVAAGLLMLGLSDADRAGHVSVVTRSGLGLAQRWILCSFFEVLERSGRLSWVGGDSGFVVVLGSHSLKVILYMETNHSTRLIEAIKEEEK